MTYKQFDIYILLINGSPSTAIYFVGAPGNDYGDRYYNYPFTAPILSKVSDNEYVFVNNIPNLPYDDSILVLKQLFDNLPTTHPELYV